MSNKVTTKDASDAVKAFAEQNEKNVAFGVLADTEHEDIATFIKGEENKILALIVLQMEKNNVFKALLYKAVEIYKIAPIQKIIKIINEDENEH